MSGAEQPRRRYREPPRVAALLLHWCAPIADAAPIVGDLNEEYQERTEPGRTQPDAEAWYWCQVVRSLPPLIWLRMMRAQREVSCVSVGTASFLGYCTIFVATHETYRIGTLLAQSLGSAPSVASPAYFVAGVTIGVLSLALGGYVAGAACSRSPFASAFLLAVFCLAMSVLSTCSVWSTLLALGPGALVYHFLMAILIFPSVVSGCLLRFKFSAV